MKLGGFHAVGGHDVEPHGGQKHATRSPSLGVALEHGVEHRRLAGDVEVVRACAQARVDHRTARLRVRTGAVQDEAHVADALGDGRRRVEVEHADGQAQACAEGLDGLPASSRQDRP